MFPQEYCKELIRVKFLTLVVQLNFYLKSLNGTDFKKHGHHRLGIGGFPFGHLS